MKNLLGVITFGRRKLTPGVICMFPYFWGGTPFSGVSGVTYDMLAARIGNLDLPEEVRAAIEERKDEIHNEEDLRRMAEELMLRR